MSILCYYTFFNLSSSPSTYHITSQFHAIHPLTNISISFFPSSRQSHFSNILLCHPSSSSKPILINSNHILKNSFRMPITWLFLSMFQSISGQPQPCFLKCKDNYMHQMQQEITDPSTEWSVDMVTPLQALLSGNTKRGRLAIRIDRVCKLNTVYQKCISICPENPAKKILINGQLAWNIICGDFKNDTEFRSIVVPCWSDYGSEISSKCSSLAQFFQTEIIQMMESGLENIQEGIDNLCRSVHSYDKCFVWQNYEYCGINAGKFLVKLTHQTSHALIELLDDIIGAHELPKACKEWLNQKGVAGWHKTRAVQRRMRNTRSKMQPSMLLLSILVIEWAQFQTKLLL